MKAIFLIPAIIGLGSALFGAWITNYFNRRRIKKTEKKMEEIEVFAQKIWATFKNFKAETHMKFEKNKKSDTKFAESVNSILLNFDHLEKQLNQIKKPGENKANSPRPKKNPGPSSGKENKNKDVRNLKKNPVDLDKTHSK